METAPENQTKGGLVQIPGRISSGGIDKMLAPRSQEQQAHFTAVIEAAKYGYPSNLHERNERIRNRIPVVGGWIADKLHHRMVERIAEERAVDENSLLR